MVVATRSSRSIQLRSSRTLRLPPPFASRHRKRPPPSSPPPQHRPLDTHAPTHHQQQLQEPSHAQEQLKTAQAPPTLATDDERLRETASETAQKLLHLDQKELPTPLAAPSPYEAFRLQRIAENRARMAALGVDQHAATLTSFFKATKARTPSQSKRPSPAKFSSPDLLRRSERLRNVPAPPPGFYADCCLEGAPEQSERVKTEKRIKRDKSEAVVGQQTYRNRQSVDNVRPANAPIPKNCPADLKVSPEVSAYRCKSKERGTLYDSIVGICCHFCRQKKLCGEENCQRCGERDVSKPCLGKTDCSKCHSARGVFCRACLKIRYGEEMDEVWQRVDWLCPHCSEEQGLNPYWICNSSICLTRREIAPTGIAIFKARELGFKSVAHYLADLLQKQAG